MQHLKEDLFEKVAAVLESPDDSPNGQAALRAALAGRWKAALDKTARFWARQRSSSSAARDELQGRLKDLHEDIHATIDAEVGSLPCTSKGANAHMFHSTRVWALPRNSQAWQDGTCGHSECPGRVPSLPACVCARNAHPQEA